MRYFCVITCHNIFNVWPETILLLPVWPRDAERLDTPGLGSFVMAKACPQSYNLLGEKQGGLKQGSSQLA